MRSLLRSRWMLVLAGVLSLALHALADPPLPAGVLEPKSAAEAWNVIRLATGNVERLLGENRLEEIPVQISYCSPSLRALPQNATRPEDMKALENEVARAFISVNAIASAALQKNAEGVGAALAALRGVLEISAKHFDPATVRAEIHVCPMHPDVRSANSTIPCVKCGMALLPRRIAYSAIYVKPGEPTLRLTATASGPIEAGKKVDVTIRLEKADRKPVLPDDLLVMHTQPIHLLIEEPALGDYHHEHPVPTAVPGEYQFSFVPKKTSPYRIWADLVPVATGLQELPFVDLPSKGQPAPIEDKEPRFESTAGGYHFKLTFPRGESMPIPAGKTRNLIITVTDANGQPVTTLEPVMNAFCHLVGFYDDYRTVVHIHPTGGEVLNPTFRGGPELTFMFYPPRAGFLRLYCQVNIGGQMLFAPFNLPVEP